jgi:hypothetical protein
MKIHFFSGPIPDTSPIDAEEDGRPLFLLESVYNITIDGVMYSFMPGLKTDYASIPRILWRLYNPCDIRYQAAALVHDQLYKAGAPRGWADEVLGAIVHERMRQMARGNWFGERNAAFQAGVMRSAVVVGGGGAYRKNSEQLKLDTRAHMRYDGKIFPVMGWV